MLHEKRKIHSHKYKNLGQKKENIDIYIYVDVNIKCVIISYCFCNISILLSHNMQGEDEIRSSGSVDQPTETGVWSEPFTAAAHRSLHSIRQPQWGTIFIIIHLRRFWTIIFYFTHSVIFSCFISTKNFNNDWIDWKNCFHTFSFEIHWNP